MLFSLPSSIGRRRTGYLAHLSPSRGSMGRVRKERLAK
jgi:hypothetical protein